METMKRAISGFLALVLILGMLPGVSLTASAEELETLPEAPETTAATEEVVTETTAAPETEAPETVPEATAAVTEPAETAPAETVPAETVPEETVAEETVAEETAPEETVPEETGSLEASAEAADATDTVVLAKKIVASAAKERTYVGDTVQLTATFTPSDVTETEVDWIVTDGYDIVNETVLAKGALRVTEAGSVTLYAAAKDGSEVVSEPITVEFVNFKMEINENVNLFPEENIFDGMYVLQTGDTLDISVKYMAWGANETEEEAAVETFADSDLTWSLADGDEKYATLTVNSENPKEVTIKAKLVTEYQWITVNVVENTLGCSDSISIRLYPDSYKLYITDEEGNDVTNQAIILDTANPDVSLTQTLYAKVWPEEGDEDLTWSCSDTLVELEDLDGDDTANKSMEFTADKRSGETVITIQGVEHPGVYVTVTIKRVRYIQEIEPSKATSQVTELMAGQSATLEAIYPSDREIIDNSLLTWELAEGDEAYATISEKGVLKAANVAEGRVITVRCSVTGNEENAYFELPIIIRPKATAVKILAGDFADEDSSPRIITSEEVLNDKTITVDTVGYTPRCLDFIVENYVDEPTGEGDPVGAKQEVTWTSSNTSVAVIDEYTDEIVWKGKNGTTTITATAADGSGKKASVKLQFGAKLRELSFNEAEDMFLRSGSNWIFDLEFYPENATNKTVTWSVYLVDDSGDLVDASSVATISSKGKLTAKTVYDNYTVRVFATSTEDESIYDYLDVRICPKKDYSLTLLDDSGNCVTKRTICLDIGQSIDLSAVLVGESVGEYYSTNVTWKTSSKAIDLDEGCITALKTGSATVTATDANKQKATVTIKVVSQVDDIYVYQADDLDVLASGKSMTLKAVVCDYDTATEKNPNGKPTVSKVNWVLAAGDEKYATVNSSGKVTAVKNYTGEPVTITVYAISTDGGDVWSNPYYIEICPIVEGMRIDMEGQTKTISSYTHYMLEPDEDTIQFYAVTYPENASDEVKWATSNKSVASIDDYGEVTIHKAGTVTISATAKDGSGKKATFKLTIVRQAAYLALDNDGSWIYDPELGEMVYAVAGGKTLTLKPILYGSDDKKISGIKLKWEIDKVRDEYGTAFVTSFSNGKIVTARVTEPKYVTVTIKVPANYAGWDVDDDEDGYVDCTIPVVIYPATTGLQITLDGKVVTANVWRSLASGSVQFSAQTNTGAAPEWRWKSSNTKVATVDEYTGEVTFLKAGTVTITATAADGTNVKDSIKLTIGG